MKTLALLLTTLLTTTHAASTLDITLYFSDDCTESVVGELPNGQTATAVTYKGTQANYKHCKNVPAGLQSFSTSGKSYCSGSSKDLWYVWDTSNTDCKGQGAATYAQCGPVKCIKASGGIGSVEFND
ncbi:hypothetical protein PRZ48_000151 [Zasmidium cellare]|uniref:Uncharacterized protein n=1 Tax=Zasmidium cellare TaxID=395010 RepID=A0ABR0EZ93_ZASCE|nr:hypothetical protein PRZ48_000151 [Zasmidium cellare]